MRSLRTTADPSDRGMVTDRNGEQLAVSVPVQAVADPKEIHAADGLKIQKRGWLWQMYWVWICVNLPLASPIPNVVLFICNVKSRPRWQIHRQIKTAGVHLRRETRRYYPTGEISAHLVGNTNIDGSGIEGVERAFNEWLSSTPHLNIRSEKIVRAGDRKYRHG